MAEQIPVFGVGLTGVGGAFPRRRFTNNQLINHYGIDSTSSWMYKNTGMKQRYLCGEGENVVTLGTEASLQALNSRKLRSSYTKRPSIIDYLFVASSTADTYRPINGAHPGIQKGLRQKGYYPIASDDRNLACTGFVNALEAGYKRFITDGIDIALVVGTEALSKKVGFDDKNIPLDRGTAIVFGDGAGAVVLERTGSESGLHGWWQETDSDEEEILYANDGEYIYMDGPKVLSRARRIMVHIGNTALEKAEENTGITRDKIDWVVPHQANIKIIEYANERLGFTRDQLIVDLDRHGNTSTASIPLALLRAVRDGRINKGDNLLMPSFGGGMTSEALVVTV